MNKYKNEEKRRVVEKMLDDIQRSATNALLVQLYNDIYPDDDVEDDGDWG